jgi:hypothetical protein
MDDVSISADDIVAIRASLIARWGAEVMTLAPMARLCSIGLVHMCWRNTPLEDWHATREPTSPSDYDMFRANIVLTRQVLPSIDQAVIDVDSLRRIFTAPTRMALPDRTAKEFCGRSWRRVQACARSRLDTLSEIQARLGDDETRVVYSYVSNGSRWWGAPDFSERLTRSLDVNAPELSAVQRDEFVVNPELMDETLFKAAVYYRL